MTTKIIYVPKFITNSNEVFRKLREDLNWEQRDAPRQEYYVNDFNEPYVYGQGFGQRKYYPQPYHDEILNIRKQIEEFFINTGTPYIFETCFLNRYIDQKKWLGWHADDSPEMDHERPIIIISLGVARKIKFKLKIKDEITEPFEILLEHGSMCIMPAGFQKTHYHCIPKAGFVTNMESGSEFHFGERISLTYRGFIRPD